MKEEQSDPSLMNALQQGLQACRSRVVSMDTMPVSCKQTQLGWDVVLDGWLSEEWQAQQEAYWATWRRKKSSKWWTTELIKICNIS